MGLMTKLGISALLVGFFAAGCIGGYSYGSEQRPCVECCVEGEMCMDEEEWMVTSIGQVDDQAAAAELSRLLDECWKENKVDIEDLPKLTAMGLKLAECRGALKECQRK